MMRIQFLILVISLTCGSNCFAQFGKECNQGIRRELGFLYYVDDNIVSFVSVKSKTIETSFKYFSTTNLKMAVQLQENEANIDTLWQYATEEELLNYDLGHKSTLKIIPAFVTYRIDDYAMTRKQFRECLFFDYFLIRGKRIRVKVVGSLPISIVDVEPIITTVQ